MFERLENILKKSEELKIELTKPEVLNDYNKLKKLSKEQSDLEEIVNVYSIYKEKNNALEEAKTLVTDPELKEMAELEIETLTPEIEKLYKELEVLLIPKDENDGKNVIMEIRGAAGGDEANIFAGDLFRMYTYYAEENGWKIEVLNQIEGTSGGFSQVECIIKGDNVYSKLKYESGSHRVQRVPATETQGRVHTSTATVLVMPEVEDVDIEIKESDLKIDVYHSSGAGGQSVNTSNSAVRITHTPTGVAVACQNERSQLKNKEIALRILKNKLYEKHLLEEEEKKNDIKGITMNIDFGSQIRSYVLEPYKLVKDTRSNYENNDPEKILDGDILELLEFNLRNIDLN